VGGGVALCAGDEFAGRWLTGVAVVRGIGVGVGVGFDCGAIAALRRGREF